MGQRGDDRPDLLGAFPPGCPNCSCRETVSLGGASSGGGNKNILERGGSRGKDARRVN